MPAAWALLRISRGRKATALFSRVCRFCATWIIAVLLEPTHLWAMVREFCFRFRTSISWLKWPSRVFNCPRPVNTAWAWSFFLRNMPHGLPASAPWSMRFVPRARCCLAGGMCPPMPRCLCPPGCARKSPLCARSSLGEVGMWWCRMRLSASSSSFVRPPQVPFNLCSFNTAKSITWSPCRAGPLFIRACCLLTRSVSITTTFHTTTVSLHSHSCISGSQPTPFPSGPWRTLIEWLPITARSIQLKATTTGCALARV